MLDVKGLSVTLGGQQIVHPLDFSIQDGDWLMLIGPNGAGKSTLLNALAQGVDYRGSVAFDGQDVRRMKARERAGYLALLSQRHEVGYAFTAEEVIRLGRYAQTGFLRGESGDLDLPYQRQIFELIAQWLRTPGRAVISVVHDLSLARRYGKSALLLNRGHVAAQGDIQDVLGREALRVVYNMDVHAWMQELLRGWEET